MRPFATAIGILGLLATLVPASASAQTTTSTLTTEALNARASEFGAGLRFRQLGDTATLPKGRVEVGVQFVSSPTEPAAGSWNATRFGARVGLGRRVDLGAWAGRYSAADSGVVGVDVKVRLLTQGATMPVSVSVRPSASFLVGAQGIWGGTSGVDLSVSRAFGAFAPYAGVAAQSSIAAERLRDITVTHGTAGNSLAFAGLAWSWRSLVATAEVEKGTRVSYALRLGSRF